MWKTLGGRCIHRTDHIQVYQNPIYRWLKFNSDALQTLINRRYPENSSLGYIKQFTWAVQNQPGDCCLLGLGGGGVIHAVMPYLENATITAVENSKEVIDIATTYFMIKKNKNVSIIHQDAKDYVQECKTRYQHLLVDLYGSNCYPAHCSTHEFFLNCHRLLLPRGILALNLTHSEEQYSLFKLVREVFLQRTVVLPVKKATNIIVLTYKGASMGALLDLLTHSGAIKKLSWDQRWGCIAII